MINFIPATAEDQLVTIASLAQEIWTEYFTPIIGGAQVAYMLKHIQSFEPIQRQTEEGYQYFLIENEIENTGYLSIRPDQYGLFLSKLYIHKNFRGSGIGKETLRFIEKFARHRQLKRIWLTVNKGNADTIAAYQKWGFEITGELVSDIGGGFVMDDYKMEKVIQEKNEHV